MSWTTKGPSGPTEREVRSPRRFGLALGAVALGVSLAACGGGGGQGGSSAAKTTNPAAWAGTVCDRIGSWLQQFQSLATGVSTGMQSFGADLQGAKAQLSSFFGEVVHRTDETIQAVDHAGVPDTAKGEQIANELQAGLRDVKQIYSDGQARIQGLPTSDPALFQQQAAQAFHDLRTASNQKFQDLDQKYNVPAMQEAFNQAPQCQQLNS